MGVKLVSSGGGSVEINPPATASNFVATMPAGTGNVVVNGVNGALVLGTVVTASGTTVDFTSLPSWVKRVTVMFNNVSLSGTSSFLVQLGSTTFTTSGYSAISVFNTGTLAGQLVSSSGIPVSSGTASNQIFGTVVLTNVSGNIWISSGVLGNTQGTGFSVSSSGYIALGGTLDRVRITTVNGTDTFDAGSINIMYE